MDSTSCDPDGPVQKKFCNYHFGSHSSVLRKADIPSHLGRATGVLPKAFAIRGLYKGAVAFAFDMERTAALPYQMLLDTFQGS